MNRRGLRYAAALLGAVALIGWVFVAPFSFLGSGNLALTYALVALSLVVLTGWVGQISLAQAAFVGVGAFASGLLVRNWGVPFPLTLPIAASVAAGAAALLGVVALRVRGLYLAVATLIFAWMAQEYLFNQPWFAGVGGSSTAVSEPLGAEGQIPFFDFTNRRTFYFVLLAATCAALIAVANLRDSKTGRAWFAVKGSEIAAASLGIDVTRYKLVAFATSGFIAGLAGNLTITHQEVATASAFSVEVSLFYLSIAVVGGLTSLGGAVAGGVLFAALEELFFRVEAFAGFLQVVSAVLLAAVLLFFPAGLAGVPGRVGEAARALGSSAPAVRAGQLWQTLRSRAAAALRRDDASSPDGVEIVGVTDDEAPEPGDEGDDASPARSGWLRVVRRPIEGLLGRKADAHAVTPDALAESLASQTLEDDDDARPEATEESRSALAYVPGTATKVRLPARARRSPVLVARDVTVQFGGLVAVDDFTLEVRQGEIVGLMGPNGAGKTTLFNAISGLNQPSSGTVELFGADVTLLPVHTRARRGMGRTFQAIQLFAQLTVAENLMVATHCRNPTGYFGHLMASRGAVTAEMGASERVQQVVGLLGLGDVAERRVGDLPFGMLRLVELGRALVTGAPFVMLDEPASGLDNTETDRFMDLLLWARQSLGISMLLIEHDVRVVTGLSDHMYVIDRGRKIAEGLPDKIQRDPEVIAAYLGQAPAEEGDGKKGSMSAGGRPARREPPSTPARRRTSAAVRA